MYALMHAPRASSAGLIVHIKLASPSPAGIVSAFAGRVEHSSSLTKLCAASPSIISGRSSNTRTIICSSTAERQPAGASADAAPSFRETLDSIDFLVPGVSTGADFQALGAATESVLREPQYIRPSLADTNKPNVKKRAADAAAKTAGMPLSYALLGANIIIYSAGITQAVNHGVESAYGWFGLFASSQIGVLQRHEVYRLASASLMHGSLLHLMETSLVLFNFAPAIERQFGRLHFAAIYTLAAIAGALLASQVKSGKLNQPAQAGIYLAGLVALNVVSNFASNTFGFSAGNLWGFAAGAVLGFGLAPKLAPKDTQRQGAKAQYDAVSNLQCATVLLSAALAEGSVLAWLLFINDNTSA